jgi:nucleotidyltransferase/DNA polymerase involved in DNA repair
MGTMLYACLYIPDFSAAVLLRNERNLRVSPLVVSTGTAPNCFVYAATQPARSAGITEGMPLAEATARFAASQIAKPSRQPSRQLSQRKKSPSPGSERGRGIRPYRLRPTTPPEITVGTGTPAGPASEQRSNRAAVQQLNRSTAQRLNRSTDQRNLQTLARNTEAEQQTQQELLELALTISPRVEDTAPGVIVVELAGLTDPHGAAESFSHEAEKLGLQANVAVSQNRFVALCAAKTRSGVTHIFPGQEAGFLHPLAIDVLPLDSKEKETLGRWGIRTVGELARLPQDSLVARFGTRGARLAKLARGQEDSVLRPYEPAPAFEEKMDFEWQITDLGSLDFLLSGLLNNLCAKLQGLGLATEQIRVSLKLTDGSRFERAVVLPSPLADAGVLLTLLRLDLAAHPPGEAIEGVKVTAQPSPRRMAQFSLLEPVVPKPEKLAVTLARLFNLVGKDRVGAPVVMDSHRPGALAVAGFAPGKRRLEKKQRGLEKRQQGRKTKLSAASSRFKTRGASSQLAEPRLISAPTEPSAWPDRGVDGSPRSRGHQSAHKPSQKPSDRVPFTILTLQPKRPAFNGDFNGDAAQRKRGLPSASLSGRLKSPVTIGEEAVAQGLTAEALSFDWNPGASEKQIHSAGANGQREEGRKEGDRTQLRRSPAFRCFRPPPEAEVILSRSLPVYVTSSSGHAVAEEVQGPAGTRAGPWKVCGEWWTPNGWQYEEWDVEVKGRLYRICREMPSRNWYVMGVYD